MIAHSPVRESADRVFNESSMTVGGYLLLYSLGTLYINESLRCPEQPSLSGGLSDGFIRTSS